MNKKNEFQTNEKIFVDDLFVIRMRFFFDHIQSNVIIDQTIDSSSFLVVS